jgi:DNA polymerase-1
MKSYIEFAHQNGYVKTISGRKCFIAEINNKNAMIRQECERLAINAPIQGSAADIIKKAMIGLDRKFQEKNLRAKMILQIHDELIIEAPEDEIEQATKILKNQMETSSLLDTPLKVDIKISKSW